ncbi:Low molecular weight phosphotyrosine protein phosphatase-like [Planoprotostelium fungivorum]|uniref:Low molecular weight phosphotyrosine protein phosphatase-like n=1 Tax=Planoprotostelium fungivorum TaxID=1890364 RepID=A0A2P6N6D2_9EUKA|nr:Low molecular weight phosphotyrosine protein phosphatase-like [Planoprotostelium fungivorum]
MTKHSVLFVCLGNICRSPMAEMVFREEAKARGVLSEWHIDSAGTAGYHIGSSPDSRSSATCQKHYPNLKVTHRARQVAREDFHKFDFLLCMDESNLSDLKSIRPKDATTDLRLFGSFDPLNDRIIEDPYYASETVQPSPPGSRP